MLERRVLLSGSYDVVDGVDQGVFDLPTINAAVKRTPTGDPLMYTDFFGDPAFAVQAMLDTGTSGILFSQETAQGLGLKSETVNGQPATFTDIGVGGGEDFNISEPLYMNFASSAANTDTYDPTVFNQSIGPVRTEINRQPADDLIGPLDIVGMPAMMGRVVVLDPKPEFDASGLGTMNSYLYSPGTPYNAATSGTDPGIPATNLHVRLSYVPLDSFTQTSPAGAQPPALAPNPFVGPDPVAALSGKVPANSPPPISIALGSYSSTGSFLFDTGAAASFISQDEAAAVHVHYEAGTYGGSNPVLVDDSGKPLPNQFVEPLGGIGGSVNAAGFYLDSLTLQTTEGIPIHFVHAPVLVVDIMAENPATHQVLTLDGDFGMNYLEAAVNNGNAPAFNWETIDQPNGVLGFATSSPVQAPPASVAGRFVFYNDSKFDGNNAAANAADDGAVAIDKSALLPGQKASFVNYTSYSRGINGIMVDVSNLAGTVTASDFTFKAGNSSTPSTWQTAPAPKLVTTRSGPGGASRIEILWNDGAIKNEWLQVTVKADANTGLAAADVFYFGNATGEVGNSTADAIVNQTDIAAIRADPHNFRKPATITNAHDINRDGRVDATDQLIARANQTTSATALQLISAPAPTAPAVAAAKKVAPVSKSLAPAATVSHPPRRHIRRPGPLPHRRHPARSFKGLRHVLRSLVAGTEI